MWSDFNGICDMKQLAVGATATQLPAPDTDTGMKRPDKVLVQAITMNRKSVFLKNSSDVLADGSMGGFELPPGGNVLLPTSVYEGFYAISGDNDQKLQITFLGGV